jgi:hypothetical protein
MHFTTLPRRMKSFDELIACDDFDLFLISKYFNKTLIAQEKSLLDNFLYVNLSDNQNCGSFTEIFPVTPEHSINYLSFLLQSKQYVGLKMLSFCLTHVLATVVEDHPYRNISIEGLSMLWVTFVHEFSKYRSLKDILGSLQSSHGSAARSTYGNLLQDSFSNMLSIIADIFHTTLRILEMD